MVMKKAPAVRLFMSILKKKSARFQLIFYQSLVLIITYWTYTSYHMAKRPFSVVKSELAPNCTVTEVNNTCHPWKPFDHPSQNKEILGLLDCAFLSAYALAMFISGYIAEKTNLRVYLSLGMLVTGILTGLIGSAYYFHIHSLSYFFLMQILTGIFQSTGWPCVVEAVGSWFPKGRRGFVMGIWNTHVSLGNILGSAIAGIFVSGEWGLSFIVPGLIMVTLGLIVFFFLIPAPEHVNFQIENNTLVPSDSNPNQRQRRRTVNGEEENVSDEHAIGLWGAIKIPGVIEYSLCLFFAKLVSYTFLFWLPYYIGKIRIAGEQYGPEEAADWSTLFDVGGAVGGIIAGVLVDYSDKPGIINVVMLLCTAPSLFLFKFHGTESVTLFIFYMVLSGFFVNGPYALITTAVSASLGTHESLQGNTKAMAVVTSIIDATGSLGAAVGPLLAGLISSKGDWADVFYMLIGADFIAALLLSRQLWAEIKVLTVRFKSRDTRKVYIDGPSEDERLINESSD